MNRPMATDIGYTPRVQDNPWTFDTFHPLGYYGNAGVKHDGLAIHWVILFAIIIASLLCHGV
jgi:hypothetical protein